MENNSQKWVHIIGIAGVTSSAVAVMFKNLGWKVTGSDENVYSPASDVLNNHDVKYFEGFSYKNLEDEGRFPDLVILAGSKNAKNKEVLFAQKQNLTIKSYPEILAEYVEKQGKSIVVTGTFGKTSITAMLVHTLKTLGINVSYMVGGFTDSLETTIEPKTDVTDWSVIEGDEYLSSKIDTRSKFFHYHPNILVIASVVWDHTDLFKTEEEYINNFKNYVSGLSEDVVIFARKTPIIEGIVSSAKAKVIFFEETTLDIPLVGKFNKENASFVYQISKYLQLDEIKSLDALKNFKGIKRRLEVRHKTENLVIIDDFGSSPAKAKGSIESVKQEFLDSNLIIVYEPNEGARTKDSLQLYNNLFNDAVKIYFPTFRDIPDRITAEELLDYLRTKVVDRNKFIFTPSDEKLIELILEDIGSFSKNVVLFLGSHNFEDKIKLLVSSVD